MGSSRVLRFWRFQQSLCHHVLYIYGLGYREGDGCVLCERVAEVGNVSVVNLIDDEILYGCEYFCVLYIFDHLMLMHTDYFLCNKGIGGDDNIYRAGNYSDYGCRNDFYRCGWYGVNILDSGGSRVSGFNECCAAIDCGEVNNGDFQG